MYYRVRNVLNLIVALSLLSTCLVLGLKINESLLLEGSKCLQNNFTNFLNISSLTIKDCGLTTIENQTFQGLNYLKVLNITENKLDVLVGTSFNNLTSIEVLSLKSNEMSEISIDAFKTLRFLVKLYLNENNLKTIDKNIFIDNTNLEILSLNTNDIAKIHFKTFSTLKQLREIDLSQNRLISLQDKIFANNFNIVRIDLSNNFLKHIGPNIFDSLQKLTEADFEGNSCIVEWISPNNVLKLNETIIANCSVSNEVMVEWLNDELNELKDENKYIEVLKAQLTEKENEIKRFKTVPQNTCNENSEKSLSIITTTDNTDEVHNLQKEIKKLRAENEDLSKSKSLCSNFSNQTTVTTSAEDDEGVESNCLNNYEKLQDVLVKLEESFEKTKSENEILKNQLLLKTQASYLKPINSENEEKNVTN